MPDMLHEIFIAAPAAKVYDALTTQKGLSSWWTGDAEAKPKKGSTALFGFGNRATVFKMHIDALVPDKRVKWTCLGDEEEWKGTELHFELQQDEAGTFLKFKHAGWPSTQGWFATCNTTWGALMVWLKNYCEGNSPGPFFSGTN